MLCGTGRKLFHATTKATEKTYARFFQELVAVDSIYVVMK